MARTPDLNRITDDYMQTQKSLLNNWERHLSVRQQIGNEALRGASYAMISASATNWEYFRSEWHKRAIARDATVFRRKLSKRLQALAASNQGQGQDLVNALNDLGLEVDVSLPKNPTLNAVEALTDPNGFNLGFKFQAESEKVSHAELAPEYAALACSLTYDDWLVIRVLISVRNAIAHGSQGSIEAMNKDLSRAIDSGNPRISYLGRRNNKVSRSGIGSYLNASHREYGFRVTIIGEYMMNVAQKFRI